MPVPRVQFTVRGLMVAVAIVAVVMAAESFITRLAVDLVIERHNDGTSEYIQREAVMAWTILHVPPVGLAFLIMAIRWARYRSALVNIPQDFRQG